MKKILKCFLFGIVLCLGLFAFSSNDNVIPFICHAVNVETCKVNFYGADNETIIYTNDVEIGSTLNEIKPRNLLYINQNSSSYVDTSRSYSVASVDNQNITLYVKANSPSRDMIVCYFDNVLLEAGKTYCLSFFDNNGNAVIPYDYLDNHCRFWLFDDTIYNRSIFLNRSEQTISFSVESNMSVNGVGLYFVVSNNNSTYDKTFTFQLSLNEVSGYEPYFDDFNSYIDKEYLNSAGVNDYSTNVSWSISPNSDSKFSFDSPINHDYNFYGFIDNGITYNYNGNVDARLSEIGDYAIKDIVSFNIDGYYLLEIDFNSSSTFEFSFNHNDITSIISNFEYSSWKSFLFNSSENYFDLNFFVLSDNGSVTLGNVPGAQWELSCSGNSKLYLSNLTFSYGTSYDKFVLSSNDYSKSSNYLFDTNLGSLVDMDSNTNFSYRLIYNNSIWLTHNSDNYISYNILSRVLNGFDFSSNRITFINPELDDDIYYFSTDIPEVVDFHIYNNNGGSFYSYYNLSTNFNNFAYYYIYLPSAYDFSYNINNYYFVIDKPSYRVNNSLCIYNFDYYNTLSDVSSLTYELQKGSDYYDVTYNGSVPNSKFLYFDCPEIDNTIFNRYVFLFLSFTNSKINLIKDNQYLSYSVGFDFNFIYYNQPLITSNGVYPYSFDVPKYKDASITFSLVPPQFIIPWNAIFYNAVVFLCFYMPLISDINNAIGLNYFIGSLLNIIDFVFDSAIGNFISACVAFLILFALMRLLFPFVYSVTKNSYNNSQFAYNRRMKKKERQKKLNNKRKVLYSIKKVRPGQKIKL